MVRPSTFVVSEECLLTVHTLLGVFYKVAVIRTEYDYTVFQECPHQKLFFDLKDIINYKKAKMKGGLGWMKKYGEWPAHFLMGTIF